MVYYRLYIVLCSMQGKECLPCRCCWQLCCGFALGICKYICEFVEGAKVLCAARIEMGWGWAWQVLYRYICSCCAVVALGFGASIKVLIKSPTHLYNALLYATCNWIALNSIPLNGNSCGRVGCINNWVTDWLTVNWIAKQSSPRQAETP